MAEPSSFEESNQVLSAPEGLGDDVTALSVYVGVEESIQAILTVSCWKLTQQELDEVNKTGRIWLCVYMGGTMPPCYVTGQKPFVELPEEGFENGK